MGVVYRATDSKLKREVAIKVLPEAFAADAERLARFEREAQVLAQLQHPNIASIYGLEESNGVRALVMELVEGEDLAERLKRGPAPSRREPRHRPPDRRGARGGAREGDRPPRPQARQRQAHAGREGQGPRLRPRQGDGPGGGRRVRGRPRALAHADELADDDGGARHAARRHPRHRGLHGAGAGARQRGRQARRHLGLRRRPLRDAHRPVALRRRHGQRHARRRSSRARSTSRRCPPGRLRRSGGSSAAASSATRRTGCTTSPTPGSSSTRSLAGPDRDRAEPAAGGADRPAAPTRWRCGWPGVGAGARARRPRTLSARPHANRTAPVEPPTLVSLTYSGTDPVASHLPDGKTIAFTSTRDGRSRIWLKQLATGEEVALTAGPSDSTPRFSPDGQHPALPARVRGAGRASSASRPSAASPGGWPTGSRASRHGLRTVAASLLGPRPVGRARHPRHPVDRRRDERKVVARDRRLAPRRRLVPRRPRDRALDGAARELRLAAVDRRVRRHDRASAGRASRPPRERSSAARRGPARRSSSLRAPAAVRARRQPPAARARGGGRPGTLVGSRTRAGSTSPDRPRRDRPAVADRNLAESSLVGRGRRLGEPIDALPLADARRPAPIGSRSSRRLAPRCGNRDSGPRPRHGSSRPLTPAPATTDLALCAGRPGTRLQPDGDEGSGAPRSGRSGPPPATAAARGS